MHRKVRILVTYSHMDARYVEGDGSLLAFLRGLERDGAAFWEDRKIETGELWDEEIKARIADSDIALALISQAFLDSEYCTREEIGSFLAQEVVIFPVILSPCEWQCHEWLKSRQFAPAAGETIEEHYTADGPRKRLYLKIREELRARIEKIRSPAPPMSGGASGLAGYVYQQDYAAFKLLASEATRILTPDVTSRSISRFKIEGRCQSRGPVWDVVWTYEDGSIEFFECKNTAITREDRLTFYKRVRKELAAGADAENFRIGWVTDEKKQDGNIVQHLRDMAGLALSCRDSEGKVSPDRITSPRTALQEALYHLSNTGASKLRPVAHIQATELLAGLKIEHFGANELRSSLDWLAPTIFESGSGTAIRSLIQGELATTVQELGTAEYTRDEFLAKIEVNQLTLNLEKSLRDALQTYSSASAPAVVPGIRWAHLPSEATKTWPLSQRLPEWSGQISCVLTAKTGAGKTTASLQMYQERSANLSKHNVLRIEAAEVDAETVKLLPQLCGMLSGVSNTWIVVDGLDQISRMIESSWRQAIAKLLVLPRLTTVLTARREVVATNEWLQQLISRLREIPLSELSEVQIANEFGRVGLNPPMSQALLACLRNPFLLSVYAQSVSETATPLADRRAVVAFDIIDTYWMKRVRSESQGFRSTEAPGRSVAEKRAAVSYLAEETLKGAIVLEPPSDRVLPAYGIDALCREGVIVQSSTNSHNWAHAWFREYAVADQIIGKLEARTAVSIARSVGGVKPDHAARVAAVGCCKWIVSKGDLGPIEEYLAELYCHNTGAAREALSVLIEGDPECLTFAELPPRIVIDALDLARDLSASQWVDQASSLPDSWLRGPEGRGLLEALLAYEVEAINDE